MIASMQVFPIKCTHILHRKCPLERVSRKRKHQRICWQKERKNFDSFEDTHVVDHDDSTNRSIGFDITLDDDWLDDSESLKMTPPGKWMCHSVKRFKFAELVALLR